MINYHNRSLQSISRNTLIVITHFFDQRIRNRRSISNVSTHILRILIPGILWEPDTDTQYTVYYIRYIIYPIFRKTGRHSQLGYSEILRFFQKYIPYIVFPRTWDWGTHIIWSRYNVNLRMSNFGFSFYFPYLQFERLTTILLYVAAGEDLG